MGPDGPLEGEGLGDVAVGRNAASASPCTVCDGCSAGADVGAGGDAHDGGGLM